MDAIERNRLLWKCRRGLLELDLVLERYLQAHPGSGALDRALWDLLDLPDNDLWQIVSGRSEHYDPRYKDVVARLRAC